MRTLTITVLLLALALTACSILQPVGDDVSMVFDYRYQVPGVDKSTLWRRGRDYLATAYGDSREVVRVQDEQAGTIIGKGRTLWTTSVGISMLVCPIEYNIRFAAKDGKARLVIEYIEGIPPGSTCQWTRPTQEGYQQLALFAKSISDDLETALRGDSGSSSLTDF